jgi:UDP-glucose 4-epimerase
LKRLLILGGNGFLGKSLTSFLSANGHEVTSVSRHLPCKKLKNVIYIGANYENISVISRELNRTDVVIHLAWDTTPASSATQPSLEIAANLAPLTRLIEELQKGFRGSLIFISSGGALYGNASAGTGVKATESHLPSPLSFYGASKGCAELLLQAFSANSGVPVTVLRPTNIYGPGQLMKGQFAVIPTLLTALRDNKTFNVIGRGRTKRDYLFIDDFVALVDQCIKLSQAIQGFQIFNVSSGLSMSLSEIIRLAESVSGRTAILQHSEARKIDPYTVELSNVKVEEQFNWTPETRIELGLKKTWRWIERQR